MNIRQNHNRSDAIILKQLREPIDELVNKHCDNLSDYNRMRLRQLAWYAVDILIDTDDIANLRNNDVIKTIIEDIKSLGASTEFIEESLRVAALIYNNLKIDHPDLLQRYKFKKTGNIK